MSAAARKKAEKLTKGYKKQQPKNKYSSTTTAKIARDATKGKPKPKPIIAPKPKTKITTKPKPKPKKNQGPNVAARKKTVGTLGKIALGGGLLLGGKAAYDASEKKKQDQSKNNKRILAEQKRMQQGQKNLPVIAKPKPKPERKSKIKDFVDVNEIDYDTDKDEGNGTEKRKTLGEAMFGGFKTGDWSAKDQVVENPITGEDMELKYEYPEDPDEGMKKGGSIKKKMKKTKVKKRAALRGYGKALRGF